MSAPLTAWALHGLALWAWHLPALYQQTLRSDFVHALQHLSFLLTALLFWWALIYGAQGRTAYGASVLYVFATAMHSGLLGVLLTVTTSVWYPIYASRTAAWGLTTLEDQQLAGLIMWVPAGIIYLAAGLLLFRAWLGESAFRTARQSVLPLVILIVVLATASCRNDAFEEAARATGGDPEHGRYAVRQYGCSSCHTIPGVAGAQGRVGPPLKGVRERMYIAGVLANTPQHMVEWIQNPRHFEPRTAMPNVGLTESDARDIASYLYSLR
jgi:putative membrane protein